DRRDVTGREQPARTEDRAESDEGEVHQAETAPESSLPRRTFAGLHRWRPRGHRRRSGPFRAQPEDNPGFESVPAISSLPRAPAIRGHVIAVAVRRMAPSTECGNDNAACVVARTCRGSFVTLARHPCVGEIGIQSTLARLGENFPGGGELHAIRTKVAKT